MALKWPVKRPEVSPAGMELLGPGKGQLSQIGEIMGSAIMWWTRVEDSSRSSRDGIINMKHPRIGETDTRSQGTERQSWTKTASQHEAD